MLEYFKAHIVPIIIGVSGFLSAMVTLFINVDDSISIKWLILVIFIFLIVYSLTIPFEITSKSPSLN